MTTSMNYICRSRYHLTDLQKFAHPFCFFPCIDWKIQFVKNWRIELQERLYSLEDCMSLLPPSWLNHFHCTLVHNSVYCLFLSWCLLILVLPTAIAMVFKVTSEYMVGRKWLSFPFTQSVSLKGSLLNYLYETDLINHLAFIQEIAMSFNCLHSAVRVL